MATSRTRNLRLFLSSGLSTEAKANLEILDRLGGVYQVDNSEAVNIRSKTDIRLLPGDSSAGGLGNSNLQVGSEATPVSEFKVWANIFELNGSLRLPDYLTPSLTRKYLTIRYDSSAQGAADTQANRELLLDVQNGDRKLIMAQDLELAGTFRTKLNTTAVTDITLPVTGTLATLAGTETLTNKTIDAAGSGTNTNTITNIKNASIASTANIAYSKLNLANQIKNADISTTAAIDATKIAVSAIANIDATNLQAALLEMQLDIDTRAKDSEFDTHTAASTAHGTTSAIVGVSDIQTLTNKTLSSNFITGSATTPTTGKINLAAQANGLILRGENAKTTIFNIPNTLTATRTLTIPNASGTIVTTGNTGSGALISSGMIVDGTIVNADVNAAAAIAYSKLNLAGQVTNTDIKATAAIAYTKLNLENQIKNADISADSADRIAGTKIAANFAEQFVETESGVKIGQTFTTLLGVQSQTQDLTFKFPQNAGGLNYVLATDGIGNTKWIASSSTGTVSKVGLLAPSILSVVTRDGSGAPIAVEPGDPAPFISATGYFDIALANQGQNLVLAGPTSGTGSPTFRALTTTDLPFPLSSDASRNQAISDQVSETLKASTNNAITWSYNIGTRELRPTLSLASYSTANLAEGTNLYYTDVRVATKTKSMIATNSGNTTGIAITHGSGPDTIGFALNQAVISTDSITEGTKKFFTDELAQDAFDALLIDSTEIGKTYSDAANTLSLYLKTTGVTSGSYGDATKTVTLAIDTKGRITSAAQQSIAIPSTQITDFSEAVQDVVGATLVGQSNDIVPTYVDASNSLSLALRKESITLKTEVTPEAGDYVMVSDTSDTGNLKKVSLQSIVNLSGANFTATWTTGTTLAVTHNLNSRDVLIQIYSLDTFEDILVSSIVRTTLNSIDLTASEAPTGLGWKVLIRRI